MITYCVFVATFYSTLALDSCLDLACFPLFAPLRAVDMVPFDACLIGHNFIHKPGGGKAVCAPGEL